MNAVRSFIKFLKFSFFNSHKALSFCIYAFFITGIAPASAQTVFLPDYYGTPEFSPYRSYINNQGNEMIDPFSGALNRTYNDIVIAGNNGLDLVVTRRYRSLQTNVASGQYVMSSFASPVGTGWDIHFGRVLSRRLEGETQEACRSPGGSNTNPVLSLPNGTDKAFYNAVGTQYAFISKDRWVMTCETNGVLRVHSPNGITYKFGYYTEKTFGEGRGDYSAYHVTEISDSNANKILIEYNESTNQALIHKAYFEGKKSTGVEFTYIEQGTPGKYLLSQISANGQTWQYSYQAAQPTTLDFYYLTEVTPPVGSSWRYSYNIDKPSNGIYNLETVTTPGNTQIKYTYAPTPFYGSAALSGFFPFFKTSYTQVISSKTVSGGNITPETWQYSFRPGTTESNDVTIVTKPNGEQIIYSHFGVAKAWTGTVWRIGNLESKRYVSASGSTLRNELYTWGNEALSPQYVFNFSIMRDQGFYAPLLTQKTIIQDGTTHTTNYSGHQHGQPTTTIENGTGSRTTNLTYQHLTNVAAAQWKLNLVKTQSASNVNGQQAFTYDGNGNLISSNIYGLTESFTRCSNGEVALYTNANGNKTHYDCNAYQNGIPTIERLAYGSADEVVITRTVNPTGTVASQTRDNKTTTYTHDDLNRVTAINTPRVNDANITVTWNAAGTQRTLTRGTFTNIQLYDGLGRLISNKDENLETTYAYDAQGRTIRESNLGNTGNTLFEYDGLNRLTKVDPPTLGTTSYQYLPNNQTRVTDGRGKVTTMTYRAYGEPMDQVLTKIEAPESVTTHILRDGLGNIDKVLQGGFERNYSYNSKYQLIQITHPEFGAENFGRDPLGNMISYQMGNSGVTIYTYDPLERLKLINYADSNTNDIGFAYDASGNLTAVHRNGYNWDYRFDANNLLIEEKLSTPANQTFQFNYERNQLDNLNAMVYPTGNRYQMITNDLGRVTKLQHQGGKNLINHVIYWPNGAVKSIQYDNGHTSSFTQDADYQITAASTTSNLFLTDYEYDAVGNMNRLVDQVDGSHTLNSVGYDGLNRLTTINNQAVLSYDQVSNIRTNKLGGLDLTYQIDANNRLTGISNSPYTFTYDGKGNATNVGNHQFAFNEANELTFVHNKNTSMHYDGHHYRVLQDKAGHKIFSAYTLSGRIAHQFDQNTEIQTDYLYIGNKSVAQIKTCGNLDSDGDLIPDCFEVQNGLNPNDPADAAQDKDGDGLTNLKEYQVGTSLVSDDTDGDGIKDKYEVDNGLDPRKNDAQADADSDGLSNINEFIMGTRANNPDTDGDGILDGNDSAPLFNLAVFLPVLQLLLD